MGGFSRWDGLGAGPEIELYCLEGSAQAVRSQPAVTWGPGVCVAPTTGPALGPTSCAGHMLVTWCPLALQGLSPVFVDTCFLLDTPLSFPVPVPAEIGPGMESGVHLLLGPTLLPVR